MTKIGSVRSVYQEPSFALEFLKRACTDEYVCLCFRRYHWIHEQFGQIRLSSIRSSATKSRNQAAATSSEYC